MDRASALVEYALEELCLPEVQKGIGAQISRFSIALGIIENDLIFREGTKDMMMLKDEVESLYSKLLGFVEDVVHPEVAKLQNCATSSKGLPRLGGKGNADVTRNKVKKISDIVWSYLRGPMKKDAQHVQHLYSFATYLGVKEGFVDTKRHLCCAGVVMSVYAISQILSSTIKEHADLSRVRMCITEDHCFLCLGDTVSREACIEVTTDSKDKRGLPPEPQLWPKWIYAGGNPVVCSPEQVFVASIVSMNFLKKSGKAANADDGVFDVQTELLRSLHIQIPGIFYPGALSKLGTLLEESNWYDIETTVTEPSEILSMYKMWKPQVRAHHHMAIEKAKSIDGSEWQWYLYSSLATSEFYENEMYAYLAEQPQTYKNDGSLGLKEIKDGILGTLKQAMETVRCGGGVLERFTYDQNDEELYKDIADIIGKMCDAIRRTHRIDRQIVQCLPIISSFLKFWDSVCVCFSRRSKPPAWVKLVIKHASLFDDSLRQQASCKLVFRSPAMEQSKPHWISLKRPSLLSSIFESADVGCLEGGAAEDKSSTHNQRQAGESIVRRIRSVRRRTE